MAQKGKRRLIKIISYGHRPCVGKIECQQGDGVQTPVGGYVKYSKTQKFKNSKIYKQQIKNLKIYIRCNLDNVR